MHALAYSSQSLEEQAMPAAPVWAAAHGCCAAGGGATWTEQEILSAAAAEVLGIDQQNSVTRRRANLDGRRPSWGRERAPTAKPHPKATPRLPTPAPKGWLWHEPQHRHALS